MPTKGWRSQYLGFNANNHFENPGGSNCLCGLIFPTHVRECGAGVGRRVLRRHLQLVGRRDLLVLLVPHGRRLAGAVVPEVRFEWGVTFMRRIRNS